MLRTLILIYMLYSGDHFPNSIFCDRPLYSYNSCSALLNLSYSSSLCFFNTSQLFSIHFWFADIRVRQWGQLYTRHAHTQFFNSNICMMHDRQTFLSSPLHVVQCLLLLFLQQILHFGPFRFLFVFFILICFCVYLFEQAAMRSYFIGLL